jgi:hypothetical protein
MYHQATLGVLEDVDLENGWLDSDSVERGDLEGHCEQLHSCFRHSLGAIVTECVARNEEAQRLLIAVGVGLSYVERGYAFVEVWREQLVAVVGCQGVCMAANLKVEKLRTVNTVSSNAQMGNEAGIRGRGSVASYLRKCFQRSPSTKCPVPFGSQERIQGIPEQPIA